MSNHISIVQYLVLYWTEICPIFESPKKIRPKVVSDINARTNKVLTITVSNTALTRAPQRNDNGRPPPFAAQEICI